MAQWDGIERAATIAQLVGVDSLGLISMIVQAAQAVQSNKETCLELVQDVQLISDLLRMLQDPEMMQRAEIVNALNGLEGTLQEAYSLVRSCRDCSTAYRIFMGWKQTDQFRRVKKRIAKHLRFYPMISHADITRRLERLGNGVLSTCSSQDPSGVLTSSTGHSNSEARTEGSLQHVELERFQAGTESIAVEEHQQAGHQEIVETLSVRKWRFRWGHWLPWKKVETAPCIRELTGPGFSVFHLSQLLAATNNFAVECKMEDCGFADVYKGRLHNGLDVMIERLHRNKPDSILLFENKVRFHANLQHKNILKLIGCCREKGEALLVYEYMANGRLYEYMENGWGGDSVTGTGTRALPNWSERFKIIIGIARGVVYLHESCGTRIMHGDINPRSILLDTDTTPKINGFHFAKLYGPDGREEHPVPGSIHGTMGYLDYEYLREGTYSVKSDVFSFGITLLNIITAKKAVDEDGAIDERLWTTERAMEKIDPALHGEPRMAEIMRCVQVGVLCTVSNREDRPSMWDVLLMLSCESAALPVPKPPESRCNREEACDGVLSDSDTISME